jgi:phosphatidylglycerol:prolipoprotein diacylglycerol transferase
MHPILFSFWKLTIYSHGVLVALGLLAGGWLIYYLAKQEDLPTKKILDLLLYAIVAGLIGARLNYIIIYHNYFTSPWEYLMIWQGGMVSYGGIIGGFGFAYWYLYKMHANIWKWLDIGIIGLMLGWTFGRLGCFLAGDIMGKTTTGSLGIVFPMIDSLPRQPVALYESLAALIIFAILFFLHRMRIFKDGLIFFAGLASYFLARFLIEFFREYETSFLGLSLSQIFLIILFITSLIGFIYRYKYAK